jgi:translation initiation factor 2D
VEGLQHVQEEAPGTFDPDAEQAWADSCVLQIKNLSPLRSSDRRKLADQIISEFSVAVPSNPAPSADENGENAEPSTSPALTSIRASLLPENCLSARFTTHAGADAKLVSGTVYVGAHPGHEERILWLQMGQKDQRLYPTVYTLWQNPGLVPLLHTQDLVVDKLRTGADLMTPGLMRGPPFPEKAKKNAVVAVASLTRPSVPAVAGICEIDVSALGSVRGAKGHAVKGVHWDGDEIWAWSHTGTGGRQAPEAIEGWDQDSSPKEVEEGLKHLELEDEEDAQEDGGVTLVDPSEATHNAHVEGDTVEMDGPEADSGQREPSTKEIDEAFQNAFLYAVYDAKKTGSAPHYGLKLPIQPAYLISNMIQPYLPVYHESQAPYYNIKKTSWKNPKRFIKHLDKEKIVKSKDRNGNETIIFDIDFEDQQITHFTPYRLPKPKETTDAGGGQAQVSSKEAVGADTSINQSLTLQILIRPSSKLVPDLLPSKTDLYTPAQVTSFLKTYIENNPELTSQSSSARFVKLDPFLANNILGSNSSPADTKALAAGEIARDVLQKRILDDHNLCVPYWVLLRNGRNWSSSDSSLPKPKSGPSPKVAVVIEKRTGTKTVTKVGNVEVFGINPDLLASDLQKKCASSTSVGQLMGGKPGMMEVLVQGDQREVVEKEMGRRGVDRKWIEVVDKTKKKSGAGSGGGGGGGGRR